MTKYHYVFRILYLELHRPIKISDEIYILPYERSLNENNYEITFNQDEQSFILIECQDLIIDLDNITLKVEIILTILSAFLCNQFYYEEFYFFKEKNESYIVLKAKIVPPPDWHVKKVSDYSFFNVFGIQDVIGKIYSDLLGQSLSNSLFYSMATLMASMKESVFEVSSIIAWNFLEHWASRYWNIKDKTYLLIISEQMFKEYIKLLKTTADSFFSTSSIKDEDKYLTGKHSKNLDIKSLLISPITENILKFSPVKYRILSMFEKEGILEDGDEEQIKKMNVIRNLLLHDGLSLKEIKSHEEIDFEPIEFVEKFKAYIYRKFLMFLKIVGIYARFIDGKLVLNDNRIKISSNELKFEKKGVPTINITLKTEKLSGEEGKKEIPIGKMRILRNIDEYLSKLSDLKLSAMMKWELKEEKTNILINYDINRRQFHLILYRPSIKYLQYSYSSQFQGKGNNPEDYTELMKPIIFKSEFDGKKIEIKVPKNPIQKNVRDEYFYGFNREAKEGENVVFEILEIEIKP